MSERVTYRYRGDCGFPRNPAVLSTEAMGSNGALLGDGWTWPIQVIEAGWTNGSVEGASGLQQYFPLEVVADIAQACNSARFGRRHPITPSEETDPNRIAGLISNGRTEGNKALATLHLNPTETQIRSQFIGAIRAGHLDLFGVSVLGTFEMERKTIQGVIALEVQRLERLISVDLVLEAGAGGKILPYEGYTAAASDYLPPEVATIQEIESSFIRMAADQVYLAAIELTLATADDILSELRNERSRTAL